MLMNAARFLPLNLIPTGNQEPNGFICNKILAVVALATLTEMAVTIRQSYGGLVFDDLPRCDSNAPPGIFGFSLLKQCKGEETFNGIKGYSNQS
mmetsp:Transcript_3944/g.10750  ORF Transcript_3944/g.10750 Transcript_3944/m.10750 type:complete len:94 (-) Transcript_3944:6-287(-)